MTQQQIGAIALAALLVGSVMGAGVAMVAMPPADEPTDETTPQPDQEPDPSDTDPQNDDGTNQTAISAAGVTQFGDEAAFEQYVRDGQARAGGGYVSFGRRDVVTFDAEVAVETTAQTEDAAVAMSSAGGSDGSSAERHSATNVQETGIGEPDILKTTGDHLYYSSRQRYALQPVEFDRRVDDTAISEDHEYERPERKTHIFETVDPANPERISGINTTGKLLLAGDRLVVFERNRLVGYDVSDPADPQQVWDRALNASVETARLSDGRIYLVTRSGVNPGIPCPIRPLGGSDAAIACTDIYHPRQQISVDVTYSAFVLDPEGGDVQDKASFVGTAERSAIYMSEGALYVTYTKRPDHGQLRIDALLASDLDLSPWVETRLRDIRSYNLSSRATDIEVSATIQQWVNTFDRDHREAVREDVQDAIQNYVADHRRELVTTGIVRVDTADGLSVDSVGEVPGEPLNQFSMDEHNGTLRIATTIPRQYGTDSVNDLYTLDAETLEQQGAVTGMGVDERVYSVRYVDETAYVVTFRRIDPFHVVDLSDPANPEEVGELELPGYSSYLHPVDENHVLGIGEEDGRVKAVLFDVTDPSNPTIDDTYFPEDARWSAISESHHAFLLDRRHGVFFLPGGDSGYVVNYTDGDLSLEKRVEMDGQARRAAYIDDYLYVLSDSNLVVLNETDWTEETSRTFGQSDGS